MKAWKALLAALSICVAINASAQVYTVVYSGLSVGEFPEILAQGRDGNLYGTAAGGGTFDLGFVFKLTLDGKLTILYNFSGPDGSNVESGLTLGSDGNFYGATDYGGSSACQRGCGTLFKISPTGTLTTLHMFAGGSDGAYPYAPPIEGRDGNFYGTTANATAYRVSQAGSFTSLGPIPAAGFAPLLQASDGTFYGTSLFGQGGEVFQMTSTGIVPNVFYFDSTDGSEPYAPVVQGGNGYLYGTTQIGGLYGDSYHGGVVYELTSPTSITVLHNFGDPNYPNDGQHPDAGLVYATDGNFYGVTYAGGTQNGGVIFQITPSNNYSILYDFGPSGGYEPFSTPMQHTNGKIYGMTFQEGVVYSFDMGLTPFVTPVVDGGKVGQSGGILGQGFSTATGVSFNGVPAAYTVVSDTFLKAIVPQGATTGFISVTTSSGTLVSNRPFLVVH